jgi:hypothetical protein
VWTQRANHPCHLHLDLQIRLHRLQVINHKADLHHRLVNNLIHVLLNNRLRAQPVSRHQGQLLMDRHVLRGRFITLLRTLANSVQEIVPQVKKVHSLVNVARVIFQWATQLL